MTLPRKLITSAMLAAIAAGMLFPALVKGKDEPAATASAPATAKAARSMEDIKADLQTASEGLREALPSLKSVESSKFRKENAEKILPPLNKMISLLNEVATTKNEPSALEAEYRLLSVAMALGDADAAKTLAAVAKDKNADTALAGQLALTTGEWIKNSDDAKAQDKMLTDFAGIAKANAKDDSVAETLMLMSQFGAANADMSKKAVALIRSTLTGGAAKEILAQQDADQAQQDMVGKPLTIAGRTTTDTKFTSADLKGKVVLIDFWATWCGPCKAELPRVKALYKTYHEKGLEIVGVDCDGEDKVVNDFTTKNDMAWVQLRDKDQEGWHALAKQYGVNGIPTMFLIDKKGVLRSVEAREGTEELVKKYLAEADDKAPATEPAK